MIKYQLKCAGACLFEGWFRSSDDFDQQAAGGDLECPFCGSNDIERAIMAPAVVTGSSARTDARRGAQRVGEMREAMVEAAKRARDYVEKNFDYVGERFPEEARRIHYGESKERQIFGEASAKEAMDLVEEGVKVAPLPFAGEPGKKVN